MDEVDGIIIRTLKSIGCELENDIEHFTAEMVVEASAHCINLIDPSINIQGILPPNMAARYRIGTDLANAVKGLGYEDDLGYHTFLYSNVAEIRKLFLFLISKMPKPSMEVQQESFSPQALLKNMIRKEIMKSLNKPWVPHIFVQDSQSRHFFESKKILIPSDSSRKKPYNGDKELKYISHHLPILCQQLPNNKVLCSSILENNTLQLALQQDKLHMITNKDIHATNKSEIFKSLRSDLKQVLNSEKINKTRSLSSAVLLSNKLSVNKFGFESASIEDVPSELVHIVQDSKTTDEEEMKNVEKLELKLNELSSVVEDVENDVARINGLIEQVNSRLKESMEENERRNENLKKRKKVLELAPSAEDNLRRLREMANNSEEKLKVQSQQWLAHKNTLSHKLNMLSQQAENNKSETRQMIEEIQDAKMKIKELTSQASEKDAHYKQLMIDYEKMTVSTIRSAYTQRILEIVASISKQNQEIDKVIVDTKSVQKEINNLSGVVERTFVDADELIFKSARTNEYSRKAYKLLVGLHENCSLLVKSVETTGSMLKDVSDLEEQIEQENEVEITESLDKILKDLNQVKQENQSLLHEIKSKSPN